MSIQCVVRVLVVDNDPMARSQAVRILEGAAYKVRAAEGQGVELKESAKKLALTFKPHVVIMDLRLSDEHADDRSGLELWKDQSFSSARCILYSAHLIQNYRITREALQQKGVKDVIGKEDSPQNLVDAVERVARDGCGCANGLSLVWPHAWNEDTIIRHLYQDADNFPCDLVVDVFGRLFPHTKQLVLKALDGTAKSSVPATRGRTVLFQIWPDDKEPEVVKLAPRDRIQREVNAYNEFIKDRLVGRFYAELHECAYFWDMGGICYSFIGSSQKSIESFTTFYGHTKSSAEIIKPLEHFFEEVWHRRYTDSRRPLTGTLFNAYDPNRKLYQRLNAFPDQEKTLTFPWFPGTYLNPAAWLLAHEEDSYFPHTNQTIIHGDLHGDNLFVDKDHAWAIDYERSGMGHILRDFVELEQNIFTRLIVPPENDWDMLYSLAVILTKPVSPSEPAVIPQDFEHNEEIKKAVETINRLRSIAHKVTSYQDMHEYYWGLLLDTSFSLTLAEIHSPRWWRALLLSSVLCSRLNDWGKEWPPANWPSIDRIRELRSSLASASQRREIRGNVTNNIQIGNITIGDGANVGDIVLASEIQKSFNKAESADIQPELKETLKMLAEAVNTMNQSLPARQAAEATEDLSRLVDEATKPTPNKKWYSVSIDGLIKAAENIDKVGEPVINLSRKVLSLLTGGIMSS